MVADVKEKLDIYGDTAGLALKLLLSFSLIIF